MNAYACLAMLVLVLPAYAEPTVAINLEKTAFAYCEKLSYVIMVSEVTGGPAIIHIIDEAGKSSSAIPIPINALETLIPSAVPFAKEIYPLGTYRIDVQYAGTQAVAEFELVDLGKRCIPGTMFPIISSWLAGSISDGFVIDAFAKFVDSAVINVPFDVSPDDIYSVAIPDWVKNTAHWWQQGAISDDEFASLFNYLLEYGAIARQGGGI